jgi:hypothetical protein
LVGGEAPASDSCSTSSRRACHRLYLHTFRGEPAISVFDWHFTPTHSSSDPFATEISSALHALLQALQPGHGWLTRFQVYRQRQCRAIHTRFPSGSGFDCLNRATDGNSSGHSPKGTRSLLFQRNHQLSLHGRDRFQGLFHSPRRGAFHRSLTVLCAIGHDQ